MKYSRPSPMKRGFKEFARVRYDSPLVAMLFLNGGEMGHKEAFTYGSILETCRLTYAGY
jgi:hypothetical protein